MKQWIVYKDGESIGMMTAKEIRHALRMGSVDPFDLVSVEGSSIKSELVEVDEIFREDDDTPSAPSATPVASSEPDSPRVISSSTSQLSDKSSSEDFPKIRAPFESKTVAYSPQKNPSRVASDRKKVKQFYLIDGSKKTLGPVSAEEVLSLYQRGIVDDSVKIQKSESSKKIPVRQFVSSYSGKRVKALAEKANPAAANPSSKVLNELHQAMRSRKLVHQKGFNLKYSKIFIVVLVLASIILVVANTVHTGSKNSSVTPKPKKVNLKLNKKSVPATSKVKQVRKKRLSKRKKAVRSKSSAKSKKVIRKPRKKVVVQPASKAPSASKGPKPVSRRQKEPVRGNNAIRLVSQAKRRAGGIISVGPLSYSSNDLQRCGVKCRLKFVDVQGGVLEAVFFKGAFFDRLQRKQKNLILSGSSKIEKGNLVLFIQNVQ